MARGRHTNTPGTGANSGAVRTATTVLPASPALDLGAIGHESVLRGATIDVPRMRERTRQRRLWKLLAWMLPLFAWLYWRILSGHPAVFSWPHLSETDLQMLLPIFAILLIGVVLIVPLLGAGRSPHVRYAASEIDVAFEDVVGLGPVKEEVVKTLNLFLAYQTFRETMGGKPRKAILFEGPPGTGKTYMAKAMAKEAGVPYLFVSSTAFQSIYYGQTGRKIRNYFGAAQGHAKKTAQSVSSRRSTPSPARSGMHKFSPRRWPRRCREHGSRAEQRQRGRPSRQRTADPAAVFDLPTFGQRMRWGSSSGRTVAPGDHRCAPMPATSNILLIGATNRADDLDPPSCGPAGSTDRSTSTCRAARAGGRSSTTTSRRRRTSRSWTKRSAGTSSRR